MDSHEKDVLIQQAKEIATFGFEQGFKQAIDLIQGIAESGNRQESRDTAKIFVKTLEQVMPELMKEVPGVGMVTTGDAGSELFIHSPYKIKVGERLAYWALAQTYGRKGFQYSGPVYKTYRIQGNAVEIDFEYGEEGLTPENQNVKGFEIVGSDGIFRPAKAEIINGTSTVKVWNDSVSDPTEVRYCFRNYVQGELCNNAGFSFPDRHQKETGLNVD